jgi:hypothetical protein
MDQIEQLREKYKSDGEKRYDEDERFRRLVDHMDDYLETASVGTREAPQRDLDDAVGVALVRYYNRHGWGSLVTDPREVQ